MKILKKLCTFLGIFIFSMNFLAHASTPAYDSKTMLQELENLKIKSMEIAPEVNSARALESQKNAESYTRITGHLPKATFSIKKEKDFLESRNSQLRNLGLGVQDTTWGISYEWSLLNFYQFQTTKKSLTEQDLSEITREIKEKEFLIKFNTYFLNYLLSRYKTSAVLNSLKKAETSKSEAQIGFELGQKTKIDVLRSEANLVSLNAQKITYGEEEQNALNQFSEFSGLDQSAFNFASDLNEDHILQLINEITNNISFKEKANVTNSPTYKQIILEEKINSLALSQLTSAEYPTLSLQGSYANTGFTTKQAFSYPNRSHSVALILSIPLFGSGSFISSHYESYFAKKQLNYTYAEKKLALKNTLDSTSTKIAALETLIDSLKLNVSQFEELYRLTSKSYQLGKSSLFELLEVQDNLLQSKINLITNKISLYSLSQNYQWQAGL